MSGRRLATCLAAMAVLLLVGCGSGSSAGGTATASRDETEPVPGHARWAAAADAICRRHHAANAAREAKLEAVLKGGLATPARRAAAARLVRAGIPSSEAEIDELSALDTPAADEALQNQALGELERTAHIHRRFAQALDRGSVTELETISHEIANNAATLRRLARQLGLQICGRPEGA